MKRFTFIFLTLFGCSEQATKDHIISLETDGSLVTNLSFQQPTFDQDSLKFLRAVLKLEDIKFFVMGKDSVIVTNDPTELIELNTTKSAFYCPFDKSDTGLLKYKTVDIARKYQVKLVDSKDGARPSANIIQLSFKDTSEAYTWFYVYDNSANKKIIQMKPKTELWLNNNKVYFIQTYHTPVRDYLELIKKIIIDNLEK